MAMQTSQYSSGQAGGANPLDVVLKHLDTVPNMIYGLLMIVLITFGGQIGPTTASYADSAIGRVLGIALVLAVTQMMGWTYGLPTALAFLLVVHSSPRLAATSIENFEDLKRNQAKGSEWFVERVLGENPKGIETDDVRTHAVQDDSETSMNRSHSGR